MTAARGRRAVVLRIVAGALATSAAQGQPVAPDGVVIVGDAIPRALTGAPGDAGRGRAIVANRQIGLCLLCHSGPFPEERFQGTIGPGLAGAGARWSEGQLRLRLVDATRANADTVMPSYYRIDAGARVAPNVRGKPILSAEQIEDVVAYLSGLKD